MTVKKNSSRQARKLARRKLMRNLTADPRGGFKTYKKQR